MKQQKDRNHTEDPVAAEAPGDTREEESFAALFEKYYTDLKEGEVVQGKILKIVDDLVLVDIGYKSEGMISIGEFRDESGETNVKVGDKVDVLLEKQEDEFGNIILSKDKADKMKVWDIIQRAYENDETVEGKIVARVKGGLAVDMGIRAFLPGSQVDLRPVRNLEKMIGRVDKFKVLKFSKKRGNIVLSRRALLEKDREELRSKTLDSLEEGATMDGIVKNITEYGAFVDLGGIDGLLHITDMSWGRVNHPSELFEIGDEIKVKVLKYDPERKRVSLGLKQVSPDPWEHVDEKHHVGDRVAGKVVSLTDYGAFVELEEGVEGLIHISEMSWTRKIKHPSKLLAVGDVIEAIVLDVNAEARRISLGLKQTEPNPWDVVAEKYPVGTKISGKIRNITDFGIFIGIDEGIDGLIHISDISWTQRIKHPGELYKKGQEAEAIVLNIDKENERFSLGIKQLTPDPWEGVPTKYHVGDIVNGEVINITDFGVFVILEEGIEGLIHVSELSNKKIEDPSVIISVGEKVSAEIINIDLRERRIRLSVRSLEEGGEKADLAEFLTRQGDATEKIGDLLKEEITQVSDDGEAKPVIELIDEPADSGEEASPAPEEDTDEQPGKVTEPLAEEDAGDTAEDTAGQGEEDAGDTIEDTAGQGEEDAGDTAQDTAGQGEEDMGDTTEDVVGQGDKDKD